MCYRWMQVCVSFLSFSLSIPLSNKHTLSVFVSTSLIETPWVNFTNILRAAFTYLSCAHSFFCAYTLDLYFNGISLPAQKRCVERLWNWALLSLNTLCFFVFLYYLLFTFFCLPSLNRIHLHCFLLLIVVMQIAYNNNKDC